MSRTKSARAVLLAVLTIAVAAAAGATARPAEPARGMLTGIYDDAQILYGDPDRTFATLDALGTEVVRVNLQWGGRFAASVRRPRDFRDPDEKGAYDWGIYDRVVEHADRHDIKVVFAIVGTPRWASGLRDARRPPRQMLDLQRFAYTAATRYSGTFEREDGTVLPPVRHWLAWNEPNNPVFLQPQFIRKKIRGKVRWFAQSPRIYAQICNAVVKGVKGTLLRGQKVACGVTAPRGNNQPGAGIRSSISPIAFLRGMKAGKAAGFDAYAHHPYYGRRTEKPNTPPPAARRGAPPTAVTLGNIDTLVKELTRLYGRKRLWITEYGYQTRPPDPLFGVTPALQARYLSQAFAMARKHPRIDMMVWFLLRDEPRTRSRDGWQSGLLYRSGKRKPAYTAFRRLNGG